MSVQNYASGQPAFGTLLQRLGGSPGVYTTIANVGDYNGPNSKVGSAKTTSHSTSIPWDTFIPTIIDAGTLAFPIFAKTDSASWEQIVDDFVNRVQSTWRVVIPDQNSTALSFVAHIEQLALKHPVAGVTTADVSFKITGKIDYGF